MASCRRTKGLSQTAWLRSAIGYNGCPVPASTPPGRFRLMPSHPVKRVLLLYNAMARKGGGALDPVCARLRAGGLAVTVEPLMNHPQIARDVTRLHELAGAIVVCGGDGSISSAAPAIMESGLPQGIIPAGTAPELCLSRSRSKRLPTSSLPVTRNGSMSS